MDAPLDVATPERVALDLPLAGIGYRSLAYLIDAGVLFVTWAVLFFAGTLVLDDMGNRFLALSGLGQTLIVVGLFAAQWLSWTLLETFWSGRTIGKRAMGIRVVRLDGSPIGFVEAAARNLARAVDFLPALYATGICSLLVTKKCRRLGDLLAGTVVVRDVAASLERYVAHELPADGAPLQSDEAELVLDFLSRAPALAPEARARISAQLVERFGAALPPEERARLSTPEAAERFLRQRAGAR
jgi:uncharacterized RDD family membrane protein YckC